MRWNSWMAAVVALLGAACSPDRTAPAEATIACASGADCPEAFTCVTAIGRCKPTANLDSAAPSIVSAELTERTLGKGGRTELKLEVSERLAVEPRVELGALGSFSRADDGADPLHFRFVYDARGDEPEGQDVPVLVTLVDSWGNSSGQANVGSLRFDYRPPSIDGLKADDPLLAATESLKVRFSTDEPVADVKVELDDGTPLARDGASTLTSHVYSLAPRTTGGVTDAKVKVTATDAAGNASHEAIAVAFDPVAPEVQGAILFTRLPADSRWRELKIARAQPSPDATVGTEIDVELTASEPLSAATTVAFQGAPASLAFAAKGCVGRACLWQATVPAGAGANGTWTLAATLVDEAGNAFVYTFAKTVTVKNNAPVLTVDQAALTWVRSPWGWTSNDPGFKPLAAPLRPPGFFGLAPGDPASSDPELAPATLKIDGGTLEAIGVYADAQKNTFVGWLEPDSGKWTRAALELPARADVGQLDTVYLTAMDNAGNESKAAVAVKNREVIFTVNDERGDNPVTPYAVPAAAPTRAQDLVAASLVRRDLYAERDLDGLQPNVGLARADGTFREVAQRTQLPSGRFASGLAYDPARDRVVLFGGDAGGLKDDTWEYDGRTWFEKTPSGIGPGPRSAPAMAFDPVAARVVMFGGRNNKATWADLWMWNGGSWSLVTPASLLDPPGLEAAAMAYDSLRHKLVLYGGRRDDGGVINDVWEFDGKRWDKPALGTVRPGPLVAATMVFDPPSGKVLLFGGTDGSAGGARNELWSWDGTAFAKVATTNPPSARFGAAGAVQLVAGTPVKSKVWLYGGVTATGSDAGIYSLDTSTWQFTAYLPTSAVPRARDGAVMWISPQTRQPVIFGGRDAANGALYAEQWEFSPAGFGSWVEVRPPPPPPPARFGAPFLADPFKRGVVVFGGQDPIAPGAPLPSAMLWNGRFWADLGTGLPPARAWFAAAGAPDNSSPQKVRSLLVGGLSSATTLASDQYEYNGTFINYGPAAGLTARAQHAMAWFDDPGGRQLVIYGGATSLTTVPSRDTLTAPVGTAAVGTSGTAPAWTTRTVSGAPAAGRRGHSMATVAGKAYLFGGATTAPNATLTVVLNDLWVLGGSVAGGLTWTRLNPSGQQPAARQGATLYGDDARGRLVLMGGVDASGTALDDVWELDVNAATPQWKDRTPSGARPGARYGHAMALDPNGRGVLFSGSTGTTDVWSWVSGLGQTPAVQLDLKLASLADADYAELKRVRVVGRGCGRSDVDAAGGARVKLFGWSRTRSAWRDLGAVSTATCPTQTTSPFVSLPLTDAAPLDGPAATAFDPLADADSARDVVLEGDQSMSLQLRPMGAAVTNEQGTAVVLDYVEVHLRFEAP